MSEPRKVRIRLKHPLPADTEIHAVLPDTLEEFEAAVARGELKELQAGLADILARPEHRRQGGHETL
jgi:hypothetical protein